MQITMGEMERLARVAEKRRAVMTPPAGRQQESLAEDTQGQDDQPWFHTLPPSLTVTVWTAMETFRIITLGCTEPLEKQSTFGRWH